MCVHLHTEDLQTTVSCVGICANTLCRFEAPRKAKQHGPIVALLPGGPFGPVSNGSCSDGFHASQHVYTPEDAQRQPQPQATVHEAQLPHQLRHPSSSRGNL